MSLIAVSGEEPQHEYLKGLAGRRASDTWTLPRSAQLRDDVVFYIKSPIQEFVATGIVQKRPAMDADPNWQGWYSAPVAKIRMLRRPVSRRQMLAKAPEWGWPKQPRRYTTVPDVLESQVRRVLGM